MLSLAHYIASMVFSLANNKPERKWIVVTAEYYAVICLDKLETMTNS
jgi:hypothetical protein